MYKSVSMLIRPSISFALVILCGVARTTAQWDDSKFLPRYETAEEQKLRSSYIPPPAVSPFPPPNAVRTMAEFEELEGIVVRWAYNEQNQLLGSIVDAAQEEGKVWVVVRPGTADSTNIKNYLQGRNIPLTNLEFVSISNNSIWCRDYGPWTVYDVTNDSMGIVDFRYNRPRPLDDLVPGVLASRWGLPLYQTLQRPDSLVHTGGNFMVDGFGTGFSSRLIIDENPHMAPAQIDSTLARYCGLHRFVTMTRTTFDVISHIDMHMKLLDEETFLIGQYPVNVADYAVIENNVNYLRTLLNCYGRPYRIIRIPMPPDVNGNYPPNSNYLTYLNSAIVNKTVLVPIYSLPADAEALQIYRDAMPGYTVVGYDCNSIIGAFGAIHCIVKEVGVREPVHIAHARLTNTSDTTSDYRVEATIAARSGIDTVQVFWRTDTTAGFNVFPLADSGGMYAGYVPRQAFGTSVWYYISATTGSGRSASKPLVGSRGPYRFDVVDTTVSSVPGDVPREFSVSQNYPNPFNPGTTLNYSVAVASHVTVAVYDVVGREVELLFRGEQQPGSYSVVWDGRRYSSGVYFFRLRAGAPGAVSYVVTRKGLLVK
jgi:agmatine/peptidylarginine deiminase